MLMQNLFKKADDKKNLQRIFSAGNPEPPVNGSFHDREKEQFLQLVTQNGDTFSEDQKKIMDVFLTLNGHLSAEYIRKEIENQGHHLKLDLIYETLEMFCRYGFAQKHVFNGSGTLYEHLHIGVHHDHLLCKQCGKVVEFFNSDLEALQQSVVKQNEFTSLHHRLIIQGFCPDCMKDRNTLRPLTKTISGEQIRIINFGGSRETEFRLRSMGLGIGDIIKVVTGTDPIIISRGQSRLALASELAGQVIVTTVMD